MAATTVKKSRPKFKLAAFREAAIEAKSFEVGIDLDLEAGSYDVLDPDTGDVVETVTVDEGDIVHVPHPLLLGDDRQDAFDKYQRGADFDQVEIADPTTGQTRSVPKSPRTIDGRPAPEDTRRMAEAILGAAELHRLLAGGGRYNDVALAWQYLTRENRFDAPKATTP